MRRAFSRWLPQWQWDPTEPASLVTTAKLWERRDDEWRLLIDQAPGSLSDVAIGPDGAVWAIRNNRVLLRGQRRGEYNTELELPWGQLYSVAVSRWMALCG